jgi:hypothetical protein
VYEENIHDRTDRFSFTAARRRNARCHPKSIPQSENAGLLACIRFNSRITAATDYSRKFVGS